MKRVESPVSSTKPLSAPSCPRSLDARLALFFIALYQRHLSPRKGFRCAYSILHGGAGCSGFVDEAIRAHGVKNSVPLVRERFRHCKSAVQTLRAQTWISGSPKNKGRNRNRKSSDWCDCWPDASWCSCGDALIECGPGDTGCCDCSPCS